jgi:predicted DNA-binding protein (UPF0251 family)/predicted Fe-Mo cluster-binding NifX family protein
VPRPSCEKRLCASVSARVFKPAGVPARELEMLSLRPEETEALRLADLEGLYQEAAARLMEVSRPTFARVLESARAKVADALINGKALRVEGAEATRKDKETIMMKIAAPSKDGMIDEHFGHCREYLVFSFDGEKLSQEASIPSPEGCGCKSNIAGVLAAKGVTHMVAGNMGEGAVRVLASHGIAVTRGASGDARAAVEAFARGTLKDSGTLCSGHSGSDCAH